MDLGALIPDYCNSLDKSLGFIALYREISSKVDERGKLGEAT